MMPAAQLANSEVTAAWQDAIDTACRRIVPSWPLDQAIAVNPWWGWREQPFREVAANLQALGQLHCLMPGSWYKARWQNPVQAAHLQQACEELGVTADTDALLARLDDTSDRGYHWHNFADLLDAVPDRKHRFAWHDEVTQQISQFCGLYFTYPDRFESGEDASFYKAWLDVVRHDRGIQVLMGETGLNGKFKALPDNPDAIFDAMYKITGQHPQFVAYATALLLDIQGWASWLAWGTWQKAFAGQADDAVKQLLAIRMAWEYVLWTQTSATRPEFFKLVSGAFKRQFDQQPACTKFHAQDQQYLWVWHRAVELAWQSQFHGQLAAPGVDTATDATTPPTLQAVFCIDVRSEPMRRALEAQNPGIRTLGFAGFFGLPLEYEAHGGAFKRPQLPGLLAPSICVSQTGGEDHHHHHSDVELACHDAGNSAPGTFALVEALGLGKAVSLIKQSWFARKAPHAVNDRVNKRAWQLSRDGKPLTNTDKAELVAGVLRAMGLIRNFAPAVLLLGHASSTANNPQRAALDCGACGGQSGEINASVLAQLLNESGVRLALQGHGITIPQSTRFYAGVHDTTTDEITCTDAPAGAPWQDWLEAASRQARKDRAESLALDSTDDATLSQQYESRSRDWAQLRPEWGLANNAAFIVAPRSATREMDLQGRSFLHDYRWQDDKDFSVLELIMTAPMLVTNWINLQYYASVTDNNRYGSGNKLLHNVVGGHLGVFEGNGGDLRIGLSLQSVHDGEDWRHEPLRLSVYIDAPQAAMANIIERHPDVANLIDNDWLYLFQWNTEDGSVSRYYQGEWQPATGQAS